MFRSDVSHSPALDGPPCTARPGLFLSEAELPYSHRVATTRILRFRGIVMFRIGLLLAASLCATAASAQQWAEKMFTERSHDFGAVPRAAKVEHYFTIKNPYKDDVHIVSVRTSCGCTQPRILKDTLTSHEEGAIIAAFNTRAFTGQHGATVTVTIDRPQYAEITLNVRGYIRTDVVLDPNQVSFGSVNEGEASHKTIRIEYAGRSDWQITGAKVDSPYLTADVKQVSRSPGHATYDLDVQLKEGTPAGYLRDQIFLSTNDRRGTQFPVAVEGRIVSELTVSPAPLMLGTLQPGQTVAKQIVVKGTKPFKIVEIRCENDAFTFQPSDESKTVHLVPVTFQAGEKTGKIQQTIEIVTDLADHKSAQLSALAQISAPLAGN